MPNKNSAEQSMVTIIVPVYNEIETIPETFRRLTEVFENYQRPHELLFIDDGSSDGCSEIMAEFPQKDPNTRVVKFSRNFGQQNAIVAGFDYARGDILLYIDADLQTDPNDIPRLIEKIDEGYDVVAGYRRQRDESFVKRQLPSRIVNLIFKKLMKQPHRDVGCAFQAIRKHVIENIEPMTPMSTHRAVYASWRGGKFAEIPINFAPRSGGESKYNTMSLLHLFFDLMMTFITEPYELVLFVTVGLASFGAGLVAIMGLTVAALLGFVASPVAWMLFVMLIFTGLLSFSFGIINERLNRITHSMNKTPIYVVDTVIEHNSNPSESQDKNK